MIAWVFFLNQLNSNFYENRFNINVEYFSNLKKIFIGDWNQIGGLIKGHARYDLIFQFPDMLDLYIIIY